MLPIKHLSGESSYARFPLTSVPYVFTDDKREGVLQANFSDGQGYGVNLFATVVDGQLYAALPGWREVLPSSGFNDGPIAFGKKIVSEDGLMYCIAGDASAKFDELKSLRENATLVDVVRSLQK